MKGQEMAQNDKKILSHSRSQELYICVKWWYLQQLFFFIIIIIFLLLYFFFSFFQNSDLFFYFWKFINKCQKEILRCAPPLHMSDFLVLTFTFHWAYKIVLIAHARNLTISYFVSTHRQTSTSHHQTVNKFDLWKTVEKF